MDPAHSILDPIDGGTLVPFFRPYSGAISPYRHRPYGSYLQFLSVPVAWPLTHVNSHGTPPILQEASPPSSAHRTRNGSPPPLPGETEGAHGPMGI